MNMKSIVHTLIILAIGYALGMYFPSIGNTIKSKVSSIA